MPDNRLSTWWTLIKRYQNNTANDKEKQELYGLYNKISSTQSDEDIELNELEVIEKRLWSNIQTQTGLKRKSFISPVLWTAMVAAMLLVFTIGYYYYTLPLPKQAIPLEQTTTIPAGTAGGQLTLSDGTVVQLSDSTNNNNTITDGSIQISTRADGSLLYKQTDKATSKPGYNTLSTALGQTITLALPDGSKVWLNAGSSLKYPNQFTETNKRVVSLTGEAFFDVAHDENKPFFIETANETVQVLGTAFNITAYPNEKNWTTTVVRGKVSVTNKRNKQEITLEKNQQACIHDGGLIQKTNVDSELYSSWKDGYFKFDGNLEQILSAVGKWYNVEIKIGAPLTKNKSFYGKISRNKTLQEVMEVIKTSSGLQFEIADRTVFVRN